VGPASVAGLASTKLEAEQSKTGAREDFAENILTLLEQLGTCTMCASSHIESARMNAQRLWAEVFALSFGQ